MATRSSGSPSTCRTTWPRPTRSPPRRLLAQVAQASSLQFPLQALTEAGAEIRTKIDEQVEGQSGGRSGGDRAGAPVRCIRCRAGEPVAVGQGRGLPAVRVGAEFERFLAQHAEDFRTVSPTTARPGSPPAATTRVGHDAAKAQSASGAGAHAHAALPDHPRLPPGVPDRRVRAALLLIHGIGDNSTTWHSVHSKLAQRFTVIALTCSATASPTSRGPTTRWRPTPTAVRDLLSVLDVEKVTVVGHPWAAGGHAVRPPVPRSWWRG